MKYTVNLLSFVTLTSTLHLIVLFMKSIITINQSAEYSTFGVFFFKLASVLIYVGLFTVTQKFYEKLLSKYANR